MKQVEVVVRKRSHQKKLQLSEDVPLLSAHTDMLPVPDAPISMLPVRVEPSKRESKPVLRGRSIFPMYSKNPPPSSLLVVLADLPQEEVDRLDRLAEVLHMTRTEVSTYLLRLAVDSVEEYTLTELRSGPRVSEEEEDEGSPILQLLADTPSYHAFNPMPDDEEE